MTTADIVASIDAEIEKLQNARRALVGDGAVSSGGPKRTGNVRTKRKPLSKEAREKIAAAQRKRWAKQKRTAKKAA
jgi:hypothetical protein